MGWTRRPHIRIYGIYGRPVPSLTIVPTAPRAWLLSTVKDLSDIQPSECFGPEFRFKFRMVEDCRYPLLDLPVDPFRYSILHGCVWNNHTQSFGTSTVSRLGRYIILHRPTRVSLLFVLFGFPLQLTTKRRPWALHLSTWVSRPKPSMYCHLWRWWSTGKFLVISRSSAHIYLYGSVRGGVVPSHNGESVDFGSVSYCSLLWRALLRQKIAWKWGRNR